MYFLWLQTVRLKHPYRHVQLEDGLVVSMLARFRSNCAGLKPWRFVPWFCLWCWFCSLEVTLNWAWTVLRGL